MATIHINQTFALTPEQYIAGLTDFSPRRADVFAKSADDYLKLHSAGHDEADITEGSGGVWERLHYDWSDPYRVVLKITDSNVWNGESGFTCTLKRLPDGETDVDVVIVRKGKNPRGGARDRRQGGHRHGVRQQRQSHRGSQQRGAGRMTGASIVRGVAASAIGTLAMDTSLYRRYWHEGGDAGFGAWESSEGLDSWATAPAPALVAKRLLESVLPHEIPPRYARLLNNGTHWRFGLANGAGYALLLGSRRRPKLWFGLPFGAAVWTGGYVVFPLLGVYRPIWRYDFQTLWKDLSAHLVFGTATAGAFRVLACADGVK